MNKGIQKFYTEIAGQYELINSLLSLGLDSRWRKKEARQAVKNNRSGGNFLDVCSGTGQTAFTLARLAAPEAKIFACDFSSHMLTIAARRNRGKSKKLFFTLADSLHLPFPDNTFAAVTISFATRNLDAKKGHLLQSFREFYRVLEPGGFFFNLETSQPPLKIIKKLFHLYVGLTVAPLGRLMSHSKASYTYLSKSIRSFYPAPGLAGLIRKTGFSQVEYRSFLFGAVALHRGKKPTTPRSGS